MSNWVSPKRRLFKTGPQARLPPRAIDSKGEAVRYLMLVCADVEAEAYRADEDNIRDWVAQLEARRARVVGDRLRPQSEAFSVAVRKGRVVVRDGPYAETKELIGGFDVIDCASREEAVELASRHPMARFGRIELRPTWPLF
jgi:hypothetical protein